MNTIKLMLVDDHQMFIDGMRSMLRQAPDIEIAATANSGMEALQSLAAQPEINFVITDINMPEMSGTELTKTIKQQQPDTKVLVLSMFNEQAIINEILLAEAEGSDARADVQQRADSIFGQVAIVAVWSPDPSGW